MATEIVTWPSEFLELKRLDSLLKCGICYDYMSTCMMTSCSHNYCSLCIRKFMQYKTQCPTCYEETHEVSLRNNRPLDEIIVIYTDMKDRLLRTLRLAAVLSNGTKEPKCFQEKEVIPSSSSTPKNCIKNSMISPFESNRTPPIKSANMKSKKSLFPPILESPKVSQDLKTTNESTEPTINTLVKVPQMFHSPKETVSRPKQSKQKDMATCPVCKVEIPAKNINVHLDACLARSNPQVINKPKPKEKRRDPLPKRVYSLMHEKDLRKNLKEFGLNTQGDRKALVTRLQRFTVVYNAENDMPNPRPVSELVMQVEREEREEKKTNTLFKSFQRVTIDRKTPVEVIEKVNKKYIEENKDSFKALIENMRTREGRNIKPLKPLPRIESDDETESIDPLNRPSTSQEGTSSNSPKEAQISVYSQETISDEDDEDIFVEKERNQKGQIDWNKTLNGSEIEDGLLETDKTDKMKDVKVTNTSPSSVSVVEVHKEAYVSIFSNDFIVENSSSSDSSFFESTRQSGKKKLLKKGYTGKLKSIKTNANNEIGGSLSPELMNNVSPSLSAGNEIQNEENGEEIDRLFESEEYQSSVSSGFQDVTEEQNSHRLRRSKRKSAIKEDHHCTSDESVTKRILRKRAKTCDS